MCCCNVLKVEFQKKYCIKISLVEYIVLCICIFGQTKKVQGITLKFRKVKHAIFYCFSAIKRKSLKIKLFYI